LKKIIGEALKIDLGVILGLKPGWRKPEYVFKISLIYRALVVIVMVFYPVSQAIFIPIRSRSEPLILWVLNTFKKNLCLHYAIKIPIVNITHIIEGSWFVRIR